MGLNLERISRKIRNRIDSFSGRYMNDTKWTKVFKILSEQPDLVKKCLAKDILDDVLREVKIPTPENFSHCFHNKGIKDVMPAGPTPFKEIEWIEFPKTLIYQRRMRDEILSPNKHEQDILRIKQALEEAGELEVELNDEKLIIYGYK